MSTNTNKTKEQLIDEVATLRQQLRRLTTLDKQREDALWEGFALRKLYEITSNPDLAFEVKVRRLLELGCQQLDLEIGILAHVQDSFYEVMEAYTLDEGVQKGSIFLITETCCEKTIQAREPIHFVRARTLDQTGEWKNHPAYKAFELEAYIGVAIMVKGRIYGTLNLSSHKPRKMSFTAVEKNLVKLMGQWIGHELERRRAEEILTLRAQEMAALYETSLEINAQPDLSALLQAIVQRAASLLQTDKGGLSLVHPDDGMLELVAGHNRRGESMNIRIRLGEGLMGRIAQTGQPMMVPDYRHWEGRIPFLLDRPIGRILGVPLKQRERVVGVLNVFDEKTGVFDEDDVRRLSLFAAQAAIAIENARLYEADRRRAEQLEALRQVSLDLTILRDLDLLLHQILERAVKLLEGDSSGISLYRPEQQLLEWVAAVGAGVKWVGTYLVRGEGVAGTVWATGQPVIVDEYQNWPDKSPQVADFSGPIVGVPIQWGDEFLGVLTTRRDNSRRYFTFEDATLLSQFATQAAIAIYNVRLYEQAQREIVERKRAQDQIRASLKEKEILLKEVNHRVKNNLQVISSLLRIQARSIEDEKARQLFKESQSRVDSMSLIHEQLYQAKDLAKIDFATYVKHLATNLVHSYEINSPVRLKIAVDDIFLDLDMAIPCGLIINELVTNALKYAFPPGHEGQISIDLHRNGGENNCLVMIVKDNGIGLPDDVDFRQTKSLGLQLVLLLTNQLGGEIIFEREAGTEIKIVFDCF